MKKDIHLFFLFSLLIFMWGGKAVGYSSRFSLFVLDVQVPFREGQSEGEVRKMAIEKGLQEAIKEATYRIIPDQGLDTTYQKLKSHIFDRAHYFVPQYKILGEKRFPQTFNLSLQITVDTILLRKALLQIGVLKTGPTTGASSSPITLEVRNLIDGKVLMELWNFFKQREDLVEGFELVSARHGVFTFIFKPLRSTKEIISQILYHSGISEGTFDVIKQDNTTIVLSYRIQGSEESP